MYRAPTGCPPATITADNWWTAVEPFRVSSRTPAPLWLCYQMYGLCPAAIDEPFIRTAWNLYQQTDGLRRLRDPYEIGALPSLWVNICHIVDSVRADFEKEVNSGNQSRRY